jgi:hypothetical protein
MRNAGCFVKLAREFARDVNQDTGELGSDLSPVLHDRVNPHVIGN